MQDSSDRVIKLAREMKGLQLEKDTHNFALSIINKRLDEIRINELPTAMDEAGIQSINIEGVGNVHTRADLWASIPADKKEMAWNWLMDNGHGDLITRTINGSTFKAFCKEQLLNGEEIPEDMFKITPYTMAVITNK